MASTDASPSAASFPARRRTRRRWLWLGLGAGALLLAGLLACEGWAYWQERAARQSLADERLDEAQREIDLALPLRDGSASTHLLAARIDRLRGAYPEAERHLSRAGQLDGMSDRVQLEWMLLRCQLGDVDGLAPRLLTLVDDGHPDSAEILEALAAVYMRETRYLEALQCLDRWVALEPGSARALDWRGWVNNQLDHRGQAVADYEDALKIQPGRSAVRLRLAQVLVESSQYNEAEPHLVRLRAEQPANPEVLVALARCWMVQSRPDEARGLLDSVLAAHPDDFDALYQRGKLENDTNNYTEAERWLHKALERKPHDPEARYTLYLCLQAQTDRADDAEKELARWKDDRRDRDRLVKLLRTDLAARPNDADLAEEAGELFLKQGEGQRGLYWLNRALALDPRNAAGRRALIGYYERTNPAKAEELRQQLQGSGGK